VADEATIDVFADPVEKIACRKCGRHLDVSKLPSFSQVECPDCHTIQTVPAQLGQFLLLEVLGAGGMGAVYQALDRSLGRYVAIKVMKRSLGDDPHFVDNFLREARAAAALNHRNIVQIYSCGQEKGQPYIVMELVSGGRFDEMIADGNMIEEVRALEIGIDVAEGLKAANDIGLIHGDIKPANVLFDKEGVAKVADFGLARFVSWQQDRGEVWGTPYYIAPEKARGQKVDHRSDIYSLGATMYHALGAKPPFDGKTATDVVLARLKNPAIGLRVIRPTLQPETADVIGRMLESDPFMRYPTYQSLIADLREALRVAKQEQRALHAKVKKQVVPPMAVVSLVILASVGLLVTGLWMNLRKQKAKEEADANANADTQTVQVAATKTAAPPVTVTEVTSKKTMPVVQPFTLAGEQAISAAVQKLVDGNPAAMREQLQSLYEKSPAIGMGRFWIRLFQALACYGGGRDNDALMYLQEIRNTVFESPDTLQPHPGNMPQTLAKYLLKEVEEGAVSFEAARWPAWYGDLAEFFMALDYLREGNLTKSLDFFGSYLSKDGTAPAWPYSLRPIAQMCMKQIKDFMEERAKVQQLVASKQATKAQTLLDDFRFHASAFLFPVVDAEKKRLQVAQAAEEEEVRRTERKVHNEKIQADLDRLDEIHTVNRPLVSQKDFRKAAAAVSKVIPDMKTPEGQQALVNLREMYDRMDSLKKILINRISASPYRGGVGSELGGDAVGADLNGIRVALGQHGVMVMPWEEITVQLTVQLAIHYLGDTSIPEKDRAELSLDTSVYCYENGGFKPATQYAGEAAKLDPDFKVKVRRMMPDLLPD